MPDSITKSPDSWATAIEKCITLENNAVIRKGVALLYHMHQSDWNKLEDRTEPFCLWTNSSKKMDSSQNTFYTVAETATADAGGRSVEVQGQTESWRRQNSLVDYIRMLHTDTSQCRTGVEERTAKQLCLYDCLQEINNCSALQPRGDSSIIPYLFERLCNCMRELISTSTYDADMCYLVHYQQDSFRTLATSSPAVNCLGSILTTADFETVAVGWKHERKHAKGISERLIAATVFQTYVKKKEPDDTLTNRPVDSKLASIDDRFLLLKRPPKTYSHQILAVRLDLTEKRKERYYLFFQKRIGPLAEATSGEEDAFDNGEMEIHDNRLKEQQKEAIITDSQLVGIKYLLAFREMITDYAERSLPILLLARSSCRHVRSLNPSKDAANSRKKAVLKKGEEKDDLSVDERSSWKDFAEVTILHFTDLHIRANDREALHRLFSKFQMPPKNGKYENQADLLVITGDIVQAQSSASMLEDNYQLAIHLLRLLAEQLWSYTLESNKVKRFLRADWQKRIVIIPGNHDYASMNDLEAILGSRKTVSGFPAQNEGSASAKFAYFLQFLRDLLGNGNEEPFQGRLNSIRRYDDLHTTFLCLNTSAGAGPLRNNKMCVDRDFADSVLPEQFSENQTTICLAHHLPNYYPDYLVDRYGSELLHNHAKEICSDFYAALSKNKENESNEQDTALRQLYQDYLSSYSDHDFRTDAFLADFAYYIKNHRDGSEDERCKYIRQTVVDDRKAGEEDAKDYRKKFNNLSEKTKIKIVLGGHIHETELKKGCYAGPKAIDEERASLKYGILSLREKDHDWREVHFSRHTKKENDDGGYYSSFFIEKGHCMEKIDHQKQIDVVALCNDHSEETAK